MSRIVESLYSKYNLNESLYATNIDWGAEDENYADDTKAELPTRIEIPQDVADEYYDEEDYTIIDNYILNTCGKIPLDYTIRDTVTGQYRSVL